MNDCTKPRQLGTIWLLDGAEEYSFRLKSPLLKFIPEKQQKLEALSFETWLNGLADHLPTPLYLADPTYLLGL